MANYKTSATSFGGRDGKVSIDDSHVWFSLTLPKEMGGSGEGSNPEQFFALGYAACFNSAVMFTARSQGVDASKAKVTCGVELARSDSGFDLIVDLTLKVPGLDQAATQKLLEAAHAVCPYSKATRGNIEVRLTAL